MSQSQKIRGMVARAQKFDGRKKYSLADIARWLKTDQSHAKKLIATLNTREYLGVKFVGKTAILA